MMKRSKSPGADSTSTAPDSKRLHSSPILKVEDRRDSPPVDSEAETDIIDGGSRNNTPHKRSQALRSGLSSIKDHEEDGEIDTTPNGTEKTKPASESGSVAMTRKKRKAGSDVYSNGDESQRGILARGHDRQRGSPMKKARLSSGSEGESDEERHNRSSRSLKDANHSQKPPKPLKRRSAGGDASDDVTAQGRHAKILVPASKADQLSHRAATQEPRPRSTSPVKQPHKRSSSFHNSTQNINDPPRRLRNRRGSPDDGHGSDEKSHVGQSRHLGAEGRGDLGRTDMDRNGRTPLAKACADGQTARVKHLLEQSHEDVNTKDYAENTPLQSAALDGHTEIVQLLLDAACDVHCSNMDGDTPLIDAVTNGHVEVVKLLLQQGVDPRRKNFAGQFPKDVLPDDDSGRVLGNMLDEAIKQRIESGIDDERPSAQKTESHSSHTTSRGRRGHLGEKSLHFVQPNLTLLRKYAGDGDMTGVGYVLDCNIKADNSCMVAAAAGGHADVLSLMLAVNNRPEPDPDPEKFKNNTPMLAAIGRGNLEVIDLLLAQKGFNARRRTIDNKTYHEIAEDRKGPRWEKEAQMLRSAYSGAVDAPRQVSSPQAPKRKRLVSGKERAEEEQQKAEEARIKAEEGEQMQGIEQKPGEEESSKAEIEQRRAEQELQRKTAEAARKEEEARMKAASAAAAEEQEKEDKKRRQAEEEERKRKKEEEEESRRRQKQQQAEAEERERKRLEAEEAEKKRKEEEERKRLEAEEAERKRRDAEVEAKRQREAMELEKKRREEEARKQYLDMMPRGLRRALLPDGRYPCNRPPGDKHDYKKTLREWLPLWLVCRSSVDPDCPDELKDELWMPNFQAAVFLYHDRLDTGKISLGWQTLPMSREGREQLWRSAPMCEWLMKDQRWALANVDQIKTSGLPVTIYNAGKGIKFVIAWEGIATETQEKWIALPDDQVFWIRANDFLANLKPELAPHLKGFRLTTTHLSFGPGKKKPFSTEDYIDGEATPKSNTLPASAWTLNGR